MKRLILGIFCTLSLALAGVTPAFGALYTASFGTVQPISSDCDDCFDGPVAFGGAAQSINFFGATYSDLFVGSNGYVTFGAGATSFSSSPLDTQTVGKMIAGEFTDLDSRSDATSNVYANNSTPGQLIVTWEMLGHFPTDYSVRSTFQLVIRSDQFVIPAGEGQIGFFFGTITDGATASAGFGDGLAAVNPGEQSIYSGPASSFSDHAPLWFNLGAGGVPITPTATVVPTLSAWGGILLTGLLGLFGLGTLRRRSTVAR